MRTPRERRRIGFGLALVVAALGGAAAGLAFARDPASDAASSPAATKSLTRPATGTQADNRIELSHRESVRLVTWARDLRACLAKRGIDLGAPIVHAKQIDLPLETSGSFEELAPRISTCGDGLGEPPRRSSLQFRPGKLILYLPKQCLLDPKVQTAT
jgi:hypothetical protein